MGNNSMQWTGEAAVGETPDNNNNGDWLRIAGFMGDQTSNE